ncbi:MAG: cytochrome b/b6 domain-containing protein [Pseudomonadota bacterium]
MIDRSKPYSGIARLLHWMNAAATLGLISSGWAIYNAAAFYPFEFPVWAALGGYLTNALRWHFFFMWVFAAALAAMIGLRVFARRGGPRLWPVLPGALISDLRAALSFRLDHEVGIYNHIQRLLYLGVLALGCLSIVSGLALWKPVQLAILADLLGGYEFARRAHFWSMAGICAFVAVHLVMVLVVPSSLGRMLFGAQRQPGEV